MSGYDPKRSLGTLVAHGVTESWLAQGEGAFHGDRRHRFTLPRSSRMHQERVGGDRQHVGREIEQDIRSGEDQGAGLHYRNVARFRSGYRSEADVGNEFARRPLLTLCRHR